MSAHTRGAPATIAFRKMAAALEGLGIADCQDATVAILSSAIVSHYRQAGLTLAMAQECADAAIADVKENIRVNWDRS